MFFTDPGRILFAWAKQQKLVGADPSTINNVLRKKDLSVNQVAAILTQLDLQDRAVTKFGSKAHEMLFTKSGLEQASRALVAELHAARFKRSGATAVADLGCGIGSQSLAFARAGLSVESVEIDELTADIARYNLGGLDANVTEADATKFALSPQSTVFLDPARRTLGAHESRRLDSVHDYSPPLDFAFAKAAEHGGAIKLGPGFPRELIPDNAEAQWISVNGDVLENMLWFGSLRRPGVTRSAVVFKHSGERTEINELTHSSDFDDAPVRKMGEFIYEPDGAIIRARLIGRIAEELNGGMLDPRIAYITSDQAAKSPFAVGFKVLHETSAKPKALSLLLRSLGVGSLEIKKRGVDVDPHSLRKTLKLKGPNTATLILTRIGAKHVAYIAERI